MRRALQDRGCLSLGSTWCSEAPVVFGPFRSCCNVSVPYTRDNQANFTSLHRIPSEILHYIANLDSLQLLTKTARSQVAQNPLKDHFIISRDQKPYCHYCLARKTMSVPQLKAYARLVKTTTFCHGNTSLQTPAASREDTPLERWSVPWPSAPFAELCYQGWPCETEELSCRFTHLIKHPSPGSSSRNQCWGIGWVFLGRVLLSV